MTEPRKITITRSQAIQAVMSEPLRNGPFVEGSLPTSHISADPNCTVCAVGAVLRRTGLCNQDVAEVACELLAECHHEEDPGFDNVSFTEFDLEHIGDMASDGHYLEALSSLFEGLCLLVPPEATRSILASFIEHNFPEILEITVDSLNEV